MASEGDFPDSGGGGRKVLGLKPRTALIGGGIVLALAIGYLLWKRSQSSSTAAAATAGTADTSNGGATDYGGELSVIQSEIEDLLAAEGTEPAGSSGGTGTGTGGGTGGTGTGTGGGTKTVPPPAQAGPPPGKTTPSKPGMPSGVRATKVTASSVTLSWNKAPNATSYRVRVTYQGKLVGSQQTVNGTSATVSGLHPDHTYTFHVASVGTGGTSAETNGPAVKTKL
jgi:hypothetical protein